MRALGFRSPLAFSIQRLAFPPLAILSVFPVAVVAPAMLPLWLLALVILFAWLPHARRVQRPPAHRVWSPAGQRWLRQQRGSVRPARVYLLWSQAQWAARSAALSPRSRFFTRGPL